MLKDDGLWHTVVFPSHGQARRADAILLDEWVTRSLEKATKRQGRGVAEVFAEVEPVLAAACHEVVRSIVLKFVLPTFKLIQVEISPATIFEFTVAHSTIQVRQEAPHCHERSTVISKIWETYVELFSRTLTDMRTALATHQKRSDVAKAALDQAKQDLEEVRQSHPIRMQELIGQIEAQFAAKIKVTEERLASLEQENAAVAASHAELETAVGSAFGLTVSIGVGKKQCSKLLYSICVYNFPDISFQLG